MSLSFKCKYRIKPFFIITQSATVKFFHNISYHANPVKKENYLIKMIKINIMFRKLFFIWILILIIYQQSCFSQDKKIIAVRVPVSSQVHKYNSVIYDRYNDANFRISQSQQIDEVYSRKRNYFTENEIFPYLTKKHFKQELFRKCRNLIRSQNPDHSWLAMDDDELLTTAGFFATDYKTGKEGYTLAAALLFGQDDVIHQILPQLPISYKSVTASWLSLRSLVPKPCLRVPPAI